MRTADRARQARLRLHSTPTTPSSPIAHAEYSLDAGPWQFVDPVGRLSDSKHEQYDFRISLDAARAAKWASISSPCAPTTATKMSA